MAKHPGAVSLGRLGGKAKSPKKTAALKLSQPKATAAAAAARAKKQKA